MQSVYYTTRVNWGKSFLYSPGILSFYFKSNNVVLQIIFTVMNEIPIYTEINGKAKAQKKKNLKKASTWIKEQNKIRAIIDTLRNNNPKRIRHS